MMEEQSMTVVSQQRPQYQRREKCVQKFTKKSQIKTIGYQDEDRDSCGQSCESVRNYIVSEITKTTASSDQLGGDQWLNYFEHTDDNGGITDPQYTEGKGELDPLLPEKHALPDNMPQNTTKSNLHRRTLSPDGLDGVVTKRSNKPLMEKRRRQKFNQCLSDLKKLVLEALKKDPSRYSKLEKVEILQMALRYVQHLQRQESRYKNSFEDSTKFRAGFSHCTAEVSKVLQGLPDIPPDIQTRIINHLANVGQSINTISNTNNNSAFVQNRINISPSQTQVILVTVPNQPTVQVLEGNSIGVSPQITMVPTLTPVNTITSSPARIQVIPSVIKSNDVNCTNLLLNESINHNVNEPMHSNSNDNSTPILNSLLSPEREKYSLNGYVSQTPASNSSAGYDSAIGTDFTDASDSDVSSNIGSPISSPSHSCWNESLSRLEENNSPKLIEIKSKIQKATYLTQPKKYIYRETLQTPQYEPRRQPLLAPKPSTQSFSQPPKIASLSRSINRDTPRREQRNPPGNINNNVSSASMWRPW